MATANEIMDLLETLTDYYGQARMTEKQARVYLSTLADIPGDLLEKAVYDCIAASTFMPKVSEIREAARKVKHNNNRQMEYNEHDTSNAASKLYWQAMSIFGASLRGDAPESAVYNDKKIVRFFHCGDITEPAPDPVEIGLEVDA